MADYVISAPPNLRSVDCCATCKNATHWYEGEIRCNRFRPPKKDWQDEPDDYTDVQPSDICDAFERREEAK